MKDKREDKTQGEVVELTSILLLSWLFLTATQGAFCKSTPYSRNNKTLSLYSRFRMLATVLRSCSVVTMHVMRHDQAV